MNSNTTSVVISVDAAGVLKNKRASFTNSHTVLAELMQNARRAGASQVRFSQSDETTLIVEDDGCGIESFEKLLRLAQTGWDEQVQADDQPFGEGFFAVVYGSEHICVESMGQKISFNSAAALAGEPITVEHVAQESRFSTRITLSGFHVPSQVVQSSMASYAKGFAIPVFLDGQELPRPDALDSSYLEINGFGHLKLDPEGMDERETQFYLQGLPIGIAYSRGRQAPKHVMHLNSAAFTPRTPDRTCLVNAEQEHLRIMEQALRPAAKAHYVALMAQTCETDAQASFLYAHSSHMANWGCDHLMNDWDVLPAGFLPPAELPDLTSSDRFWGYERRGPGVITREQVQRGEVVIYVHNEQGEAAEFSTDGYSTTTVGGNLAQVWACVQGWRRASHSVPSGHWAREGARDLAELRVEIRPAAPIEGHFSGRFVQTDVIACDALELSCEGCTSPVSDQIGVKAELPEEHLHRLYVPASDGNFTGGLSMMSSYLDESECFDGSSLEMDEAAIRAVVLSMTKSPGEALKQILMTGDWWSLPGLRDTQHLVVTTGCEMKVVELGALVSALMSAPEEALAGVEGLPEQIKALKAAVAAA